MALVSLDDALKAERAALVQWDFFMEDLLVHGQPHMRTAQGSAEWNQARSNKITASNFGTIAGLNQYCTPLSLWKYATGRIERDSLGNEHTERGNTLEPVARVFYEEQMREKVRVVGLFVHPQHDWLAASPDGLLGKDGLLEIKCPARQPHAKVPPEYMAQVQGQLHVSGRSFARFLSFVPGVGATLHHIERSQAYWDWLFPRLQTMFACIQADMDPSGDDLPPPPLPQHLQPPDVKVELLRTWSLEPGKAGLVAAARHSVG